MAQINAGLRGFLRYSILYEAFQGIIGSVPARTRFVKEFIRPFPGAKILDIGCGPGGLVGYLPENVVYVGYDLNPKYIETAIATHGSRGTFFCADAGTEEGAKLVQSDFDIVLAIGLFHHLDDHEAHNLVKSAWKHLKAGGVFVTNDGAFTTGQSPLARFIVSQDRGRNIRRPDEYTALLSQSFAKVEGFVLDDLLRIPYTNFIMRATKL